MSDNNKTNLKSKTLLPIFIRVTILIFALYTKLEIFGIQLTYLLFGVIFIWIIFDLFKNLKRSKRKSIEQ